MIRRSVATLALALAIAGVLAAETRAEPPLQTLARDVVGAGQGVFAVAEDGTVLASEAADRAVHPASVTKVATSLALLQRLGPDHRFTTKLAAAGAVDGGTLHGDLVVEAGNDPFLVNEGALMILERLRALGVRKIAGAFVVDGPLIFDWQRDPSGTALRRVLAGDARGWKPPVGAPALRDVALAFAKGAARAGSAAKTGATPAPLLTYRSPPLLAVLKALNGYSNNVFHFASDAIGGPRAVETIARAAVPADQRAEILIANAAGGGSLNRISPRAAVALLHALAAELARLGRDVTAVLPVSGIDQGTLRERLLEAPAGRGIVVGKTGTFGSEGASALAGMLRTRRYGIVTFAVLNHGVPVPEARRRQDAFVERLVTATGATAWPYATAAAPAFDQAVVE
jgi:D-alanyl-D-alanine carboxypeptidase/D-alanyl-D-alanine-endopeptidase (penicillin-binding protein 4)